MQNYTAGTSIAPGTTYVRQEPVGSATLEGNVTVPFLQSLISGVFVGIGAGACAMVADSPKSVGIGLVAAGVTSGLTWLVSVRQHNSLLWRMEEFIGADIDQDGEIGKPRQTPIDEVDERYPNGSPKVWRLDWLPITPEETQKLAVAVLVQGVRFTRRELTDAKVIKFDDYSKVKEVLQGRGMLCKNGTGVSLTRGGYQWFSKQLPEGMTPLPYTSLQ